ncbi:MAG: DUF1330 domain-containing protein [Myxococcota bacterium]
MSEPTTLIVTATPNPNEMESMQGYLKGVLPLLMGAGGKLIKRVKVTDVVGGERSFGMVLVMGFDSKDKVTDMFASEDYQALVPMRDRGFSSITLTLGADM